MSCFKPVVAYWSRFGKGVTFSYSERSPLNKPLKLPCGKCLGCYKVRINSWANRCVHEASLHEKNCFITLTFNDDYLKPSLDKKDFTLFIKRLRRRVKPLKVRYFHCGEYGENYFRPHHHALLFGVDFPDKVVHSRKNGVVLYRSDFLESLWPFGFSSIGEVNYATASYIASYINKKVDSNASSFDLSDSDKVDLSAFDPLQSEYVSMSLKPAIGHNWIEKYKDDVYPRDYLVTSKGFKNKPPRAYDKYLQRVNPELYDKVKRNRVEFSALNSIDNTDDRLFVKEECLRSKLMRKFRSYENI